MFTVAVIVALAVGLGLSIALLIREQGRHRRAELELEELREAITHLVTHTVDTEERERRRIAQGIHDGPMQTLLVAFQDLKEVADADSDVERVASIVSDVIDDMRRAVSELHPATMSHGDLGAALRTIGEQAAALGHFDCTVRVDDEARDHDERLVISVARELLTNAAKHSRAHQVVVTVRARGDVLVLRVVDDGVGISRDTADSAVIEGHVGLASLSERLRAIGGTLELTTTPGGGTVATAEMPI